MQGDNFQMTANLHPDRLVDDRQAAQILGVSRGHLKQLRVKGGGPAYCRLGGRIARYLVGDLLDWARSTRVKSTSAAA